MYLIYYCLNLIYNSKMMVLPISIGTGTRIKIKEGISRVKKALNDIEEKK